MSEVTVISLSPEQVGQLFDDRIEALLKSKAGSEDFKEWAVDRKFLKMNFGWSRRKIEDMERSGQLRPVPTTDGKSRFYRLDACFRIYQNEKKAQRHVLGTDYHRN